MNTSLHAPSTQKIKGREELQSIEPENSVQHDDRLAKVLLLHSKGYPQSEIATLLRVNQSTVSRDLAVIRKKTRKTLDLYIKEEIPNEFQIYISGLNEITKSLWQMVEDKNPKITTRDRTYVLSLLMLCYSKRIEMLVGGPESEWNAKRHMRSINYDEQNKIDSLMKRYTR